MRHFSRKTACIVIGVLALGVAASLSARPAAAADALQTPVPSIALVDADSGSILFEKAADEVMPPASLAKLMALMVVFDAIKAGTITLDTEFTVSKEAWRRGGGPARVSAMYLVPDSRVKVSDLIRGGAIQSGNDAMIVLAEGLAGSEDAFAARMNAKAQALGLERSRFGNSTGLNHPDNRSTARDMAKIAQHLLREYSEFYPIFGEKDFAWNNIRQTNRNPLVALNIGVDGLKTGYLEESGYGIVASAVQKGQRLILVALGAETAQERTTESRKILDWGFTAFDRRPLFAANEVIGEARVFGGADSAVTLVSERPVTVLLPRGSTERLTGRIIYAGPVPAPVRKGTRLATLRVMRGTAIAVEVPLVAASDIERGSLTQRAWSGVVELVGGAVRAGLARP